MSQSASQTLRQRRNIATSGDGKWVGNPNIHPDAAVGDQYEENSEPVIREFLSWVNVVFGLLVMVVIAQKYSLHLKQLHENEMWFSNIETVEQEISFRTESGLYYSYYKQIVQAPTLSQGIDDLIHDKITEHPSTINVLARMNIYQEVILAAVYRTLPYIKEWYKPVEFYINTVFCLQGVMLSALYLMTWILSGTWIAGILMAAFLAFNREDVTRVSMSIPLRENWSLPFFWTQIMLLTYYFRPNISARSQKWCTIGLIVSTTLFAVTWQFGQFVLLLQAMALFGTQLLDLLPHHKIVSVYLIQILAMLLVCLLQFGSIMVLTGPLFSFVPAALLIMYIQNHHLPVCRGGIVSSLGKVLLYIISGLALMMLFNTIIRLTLNDEADEHIYQFVMSKFGWHNPRDFDVNLYLCNGAFQFLPIDTFIRLSVKLVFPIYLLVHTVILAVICSDLFSVWSTARPDAPRPSEPASFPDRPQLAYHAIQAVFYGVLAVTTLRMKYFWTPYVFVMASAGLCDPVLWAWLMEAINIHNKLKTNLIRHAVLVAVFAALLYIALPPALKELEMLQEFYDPDTVDLMQWINDFAEPCLLIVFYMVRSATDIEQIFDYEDDEVFEGFTVEDIALVTENLHRLLNMPHNTVESAAFTGSMQLLAGIKLCTGRHITNHPHYEDKSLRTKTKQLYQIYGHRMPEDVHTMLLSYDTDYIILEDSICLSPKIGCRLPDIVDLHNGVIPREGPNYPGLVATKIPLFCDEIRHGNTFYTKYFKQVFINRTFRVYEIIKPLHQAS